MILTLKIVVYLACSFLLVAPPINSNAAEQRCNALGGNCVCSEPLQMTGFTGPLAGWGWNPNDTTTKQCTLSGSPGTDGWAIDRSARDLLVSTNPTALSALPSGHAIQRFLALPPGHAGAMYGGNQWTSGYMKRLAVRWYLYYSPDFQPGIKGTSCDGQKLAYFENQDTLSGVGLIDGNTAYNYYNFVSNQFQGVNLDCCHTGPVANAYRPDGYGFRGKWIRFEIVMTNRARGNAGYRLQAFVKNVTDNRAEMKFIDTAETCPTCGYFAGGWTAPTLIPNQTITAKISNWRNAAYSPGCAGWIGTSHLMYAGWDSDAGQRIGAAVEIEGGGGQTITPPPTPSQLQVR